MKRNGETPENQIADEESEEEVPVEPWFCDGCSEEVDTLYFVDGKDCVNAAERNRGDWVRSVWQPTVDAVVTAPVQNRNCSEWEVCTGVSAESGITSGESGPLMAMTTLIRLVRQVDSDLEQLFKGDSTRRDEVRCALVSMLLTASSAYDFLSGFSDASVRGLQMHTEELSKHLMARSFLPEALCARYRYGQSKSRVLTYYRLRESDWQFVHGLARDCGLDLEAAVNSIQYETLEWHDELERQIVSMRVVIDPRALDDMLVCALEAYLSPRKRKAYEVYGITLGMFRDVHEEKKGSGRMITRYVSIVRAQPQLSALSGPRHVKPSYRSLDALTKAAETLFPQHQLMGDFHSHVYADVAELRYNKGWEPSDGDARFCMQWARLMRQLGHAPQVDLVIAIARCKRRVHRSHYAGMEHTLQATVGDCRAVIGAFRVLQSGSYTTSGVLFSVPGMAT